MPGNRESYSNKRSQDSTFVSGSSQGQDVSVPFSGTLGRANSAQPLRELKLGYTSLQRNKIVLPSEQCSIIIISQTSRWDQKFEQYSQHTSSGIKV